MLEPQVAIISKGSTNLLLSFLEGLQVFRFLVERIMWLPILNDLG